MEKGNIAEQICGSSVTSVCKVPRSTVINHKMLTPRRLSRSGHPTKCQTGQCFAGGHSWLGAGLELDSR